MYLARGLESKLQQTLAVAPLVILEGARAVGKTRLVNHAIEQSWLVNLRSFLELAELEAATAAPRDYVFNLPHGTAIDEAQLCEAILLPIKERIETSSPGALLLTGSTRLRRDALGGSDPLAGRVGSPLRLGPLTLGERDGTPIQLVGQLFDNEPGLIDVGRSTSRSDLIDLVKQVGMPGLAAMDGSQRDEWARSYLRQVTSLSNFESLDVQRVNQLARFLCGRTSTLVNVKDFGQEVELARPTVEKYLARLEEALVIHRLRGWRRSKDKSETDRPKLHFFDVGVACAAARMKPDSQSQDLGRLVESLVVTELIRQCDWLADVPECYHWRRSQRHEVDLVIEGSDGRAVCVEVKTAERVQPRDFDGIDAFRGSNPAAFHRGFVFYSGSTVLPFGDDRWAIPIAALRTKIEAPDEAVSLSATVAAIRTRNRDRMRGENQEAEARHREQVDRQNAALHEVRARLSELGATLDGYIATVEMPVEQPLGPRVLELRVQPSGGPRETPWETVVSITAGSRQLAAHVRNGRGMTESVEQPIDDRPAGELVASLLSGVADHIGAKVAELDLRFGL